MRLLIISCFTILAILSCDNDISYHEDIIRKETSSYESMTGIFHSVDFNKFDLKSYTLHDIVNTYIEIDVSINASKEKISSLTYLINIAFNEFNLIAKGSNEQLVFFLNALEEIEYPYPRFSYILVNKAHAHNLIDNNEAMRLKQNAYNKALNQIDNWEEMIRDINEHDELYKDLYSTILTNLEYIEILKGEIIISEVVQK